MRPSALAALQRENLDDVLAACVEDRSLLAEIVAAAADTEPLRAALGETLRALVAIDTARHEPANDAQRAGATELRRVIDTARAALARAGGRQ